MCESAVTDLILILMKLQMHPKMSRFTHKLREKYKDLRKRHWGKDRYKFGKCAPLLVCNLIWTYRYDCYFMLFDRMDCYLIILFCSG